jgi:hypothetical protein
MDASVFKKVAIGVVAENIEVKSGTAINNTVRVTPTEWLSMRDGELANNPTPMTYKSQDAQGVETQGGFITNNTIPCEWLPAGANRLTPPTVRRGMRVELFQTADEAKYYWRYLGLDDHLMKLETIIFGISANTTEQKPGEKMPLDPKSMYWFEMSSHSKKVALQTSKVSGEFCSYEMFFDLAGGEFSVNDDLGNWMLLNSKNHLIHLQNQDGTFVKLDKKNIEMFAPQDINAKATQNVNVEAGKDVNIKAGTNINAKAGTQAMVDGGGSVLTLQGGGTTLKTPQFDITTG